MHNGVVVKASGAAESPMRIALPLLLLCLACGCHTHVIAPTTRPSTPTTDLGEPTPNNDVEAIAVPPAGWKPDPLKSSRTHKHQVWISPSGNTAYGIIFVHMPLPVGANLALGGFLREMKRTEGEANLVSNETDPSIPGIRFVAEGGLYKIRGKLTTRGWVAWVIYAGTLRNKPEVPRELVLAERAREATIIGLPPKLDPP